MHFRSLYQTKQYDQALVFLKSKKIQKDTDSKILWLMERGIIQHAKGDYLASIATFNKAKQLARKMFTVLISKKIKGQLTNENYDYYYARRLDRSLIEYYLVLNHLILHFNQKDPKGDHLSKARAEVLSWDSLIKEFKDETQGKSVFKIDLLAKIFGAFVHEIVGSRNDLNTALILYKDARKYLFRNYNIYKTFNSKASKFKKKFSELPKMKKKVIQTKYVASTKFSSDLDLFLKEKIYRLTVKISPGKKKRIRKQLGFNKKQADSLDKLKRNGSLFISFHNGIVPEVVAQKHYYGFRPLIGDSSGARFLKGLSAAVLTIFIANKLKLYPPPGKYYGPGHDLGVQMTHAITNDIGFGFEMPKVNNSKIEKGLFVVIRDLKGVEVLRKPIPVVNPIGDILAEIIAEESVSRFVKTASRVGLKYLSAIAIAYGTYQTFGGAQRETLALNAALLGFYSASKTIELSEQADTRFWTTVPHNVRLVELSLPYGSYTAYVSDGGQFESNIGNFQISKDKPIDFIKYSDQ